MRILLVLVLQAVFALSSPSFAAAASTTPAKHAGGVSDNDIEANLHAKLAKSKIGKDGFKFHVAHGVVTWEGSTTVMQHKGSATRMAHSAGAVKVVNNIQVAGGAKPFTSLKKAEVVQ